MFDPMIERTYYLVDVVSQTSSWEIAVAVGTILAAIFTAAAAWATASQAIQTRKTTKILEQDFFIGSRPFLGISKMHNEIATGTYVDIQNCGRVLLKYRSRELRINGDVVNPPNTSAVVLAPGCLANFFFGALRDGDIVSFLFEYDVPGNTGYRFQTGRTFKMRAATTEILEDDIAT
jgi:hypothetical protein